MISVVNRNDYRGPGDKIDRSTVLGNPFVIGKDGSREEVIEKYNRWLWDVMQSDNSVNRAVNDLARRYRAGEHLILICCCKPLGCHGDILSRAIKWIAERFIQG